MKNKEYYHGTIAWDGYSSGSMEFSVEEEQYIFRHSLDDLIEGFCEYLSKYKARSPYIACASHEINGQEKDITESVKKYINTIEENK